MFKDSTKSLTCIGLAAWVYLACCLSGCESRTEAAAESTAAQAASFFVAKPGADGSYIEMSGNILKLDCRDMEVEVDGKRLLFERKIVRRIAVGDTGSSIGKTASNCWNQEESALVPLLKSLDFLPAFMLAIVQSLNSPHVQTFLVILMLLAAVVLVLYKAYDFFYLAGTERSLNMEKLNMEVRKLRYELDTVEKQMGIQPPGRQAPEGASAIPDRVRARIELPKLHILDFVKYKILRLLTEQQKKKRYDRWINTWQAARSDGKGSPSVRRFLATASYGIGAAVSGLLVATFCLGVLISLLDSTLGASFGVTCLVLSLVFLSVFLRLLALRGIVSDSYREAHRAPS